MSAANDPPPNAASLRRRVANVARKRTTTELRVTVAVCNTVIGQMLPPGVVKGGTAMKLRMGEANSRFTADIDSARKAGMSLGDYIDRLEQNLRQGWHGFSGRLVPKQPATPAGVPDDYVMKPFEIKLEYVGKPVKTMSFELGRDEVGSTETSVTTIARDILELFAELGLPLPGPVPLLATEHQIAQKLHACTTPDVNGGNDRAHDLVDLQLLVAQDPPDLAKINRVGSRLFVARRVGQWPPHVRAWPGWQSLYRAAADGLQVLPEVEGAIEWANDFLAKVAQA